jgi:type I restriction enzyme S subunit
MTATDSLADTLPAHWQLKRLKFIARVQTGMAKGKDLADADTVEVPYLRVANVQDGYLALDDVATMAVPVADLDRYRLQPGDVLMNEGGDFDKLGRGHVWHGQIDPCIHQNHVFAVRPHGVSPAWLNAWTGSAPAQFYFMGRAKQSTNLASISSSNVMELPVPVPPPEEQVARLAFIDRETARIDALIEKKTRFVALLREKRQALITQAVTRGLDPDVAMKDSGLEWLGRVPAHWDVKPLKLLVRPGSSVTYGIVQPGDALSQGVPFIQTTNMSSGDFDLEKLQRTSPEIASGYPRSQLTGGEVVLGIRASIGAAYIVPDELIGANISRGVARIECSRELQPAYLMQYLNSRAVADYWGLSRQGSTFNEVSIETVRELAVPVPPIDEQRKVAAASTLATARLDALARAAQRSVVLLKEHRSALITAAVTGQLDPEAMRPRT